MTSSNCTLQILTRFSVVCMFQCPGYNASLGKTSRNLITRCREHFGISKAAQKIKVSTSAILDHFNQSGHAASLEGFLVLDRANDDFDLLIYEYLLILCDRRSPTIHTKKLELIQQDRKLIHYAKLAIDLSSFTYRKSSSFELIPCIQFI